MPEASLDGPGSIARALARIRHIIHTTRRPIISHPTPRIFGSISVRDSVISTPPAWPPPHNRTRKSGC